MYSLSNVEKCIIIIQSRSGSPLCSLKLIMLWCNSCVILWLTLYAGDSSTYILTSLFIIYDIFRSCSESRKYRLKTIDHMDIICSKPAYSMKYINAIDRQRPMQEINPFEWFDMHAASLYNSLNFFHSSRDFSKNLYC